MSIRVFKRKAWARDKTWPGGWKPYVGRKSTVRYVDSEDEARAICQPANAQRKSKGEPFYEYERG